MPKYQLEEEKPEMIQPSNVPRFYSRRSQRICLIQMRIAFLPYLATETVRLDQLVGEAEEELLCDSKLVDDVGDGRGDRHGGESASNLSFVPLHIARSQDDLSEEKVLLGVL